ncbi:PP2C family protein-serine/threonine phosphatase [Streptomyces sp. NPDC087440]|uniref:PP2C family protein-serine/threonine phosphatase n=1 Tax=Streptomyces sp. NPDC087440 TaxID=3365790 RepID=UPI003829A9BF
MSGTWGAAGAGGAGKWEDWSTELHGLWSAALRVTDVTALSGPLYQALLEQPGVVAVVGARWSAGRLRYVRLQRAGDETPALVPLGEPSVRRSGPVREDSAVQVREYETAAGAGGLDDPAEAALLRDAGAVRALEYQFTLDTGDVAALTVGLDASQAVDTTLHLRMRQVCEILVAGNRRILEEQRHEHRQVRDAFLAEASLQMDSSLDVDETLARVARLAVPALADGCMIHLADVNGRLTPSASAHVAAGRQAWLAGTARHDAWLAGVLTDALDRRSAVQLRGDDLAEGPFGDRGRGVRAMSASPLWARGRALGTLTFLHRREDGGVDPELLGDLAARAALAIDSTTLYEQQRRHVESLQRHLLPRALPEIPGLRLSASYEVADATLDVGGDFYDAVPGPGGAGVTLFIGDVCGRGAEAAALTGLARHTLRTLVKDGTGPAQALTRLNAELAAEHTSRFVTALVVQLRPVDGEFRALVSSAGHPRPLVRRADGRVETVPVSGMLLGVLASAQYTTTELRLGRGDSLVLFTDGLTEARAADGAFFETSLPGALAAIGGKLPEALAERLTEAASGFRVSGADDTAVLAAHVEEAS